jgi:amino acid transporter
LYGLIEVVGGTLKLAFLVIIIGCMIAINQGAGLNHHHVRGKIGKGYYPSNIMVHDTEVTSTWAQAFLMSLSIASFAYVGVEITAASALEARVVKEKNSAQPRTVGRTVKFSAVYISFFAAVIYVLAGVLVTLNIDWDNKRLPRMSWAPPSKPKNGTITSPFEPNNGTTPKNGTTTSAFVLAAELSAIPELLGVINVFLMFTALSSANTNLYVASRTLFSLTRSLNGGSGQPWYTRCLAYFGKTNNRKVPLRALVASCIFLWVPFVSFAEHNDTALETLSQIGSVSVIIVWACECWAYIRFRRWYVPMRILYDSLLMDLKHREQSRRFEQCPACSTLEPRQD